MSALKQVVIAEPMSQREITEKLNIREFILLCSTVDNEYGKKLGEMTMLGQQSSHSDNKFKVKGRVEELVKFDVLGISRTAKKLSVIVELEGNRLVNLNFK